MRTRLLLAALIALASQSAIAANRLVRANELASVRDSGLSVTPSIDWNRLGARPGRDAETWSLDGDALNNVTFYAGVESDRPILREVSRRSRPLPRFSSTMLLTDLPSLLENSYRIARSVSIYSNDRLEPIQFAGRDGIRFEYSFVGSDEVRRRGEAYGAIIDGKLYLVAFEAPAIHFFDATIEDFRRLVSTAVIANRR